MSSPCCSSSSSSSSSPPPPCKRQRWQSEEYATTTSMFTRRKRLYLALDDWKGAYSIHELDADDMEPSGRLPDRAAQRIASPPVDPRTPARPMAFAAVGTTIFIDTNPYLRTQDVKSRDQAPPTFVYDTSTGALALGPRLPDCLHDLAAAMPVGDKLYAVTRDPQSDEPPALQVLSWAPKLPRHSAWERTMEWSWRSLPLPTPPPLYGGGSEITAYAVHPDGCTLFVSRGGSTVSYDTSSDAWRELGDWTLPFRGQGHYDEDLEAWVGLHRREEGYLCCCAVASRSAAASRAPECKILRERMYCFRSKELEKGDPIRRHLRATLTYMGDGSFCLVENVMHPEEEERTRDPVSELYVTLFGLKYDCDGELQTKARRTARSYQVSKQTRRNFSHAAFWM